MVSGRGLDGRYGHELIVGVAAVHVEVVCAAAAAIHRDNAGVVAAGEQRVALLRLDAGLELQQLVGVARVQRQVHHGAGIHHGAQLRAGGFDQGGLRLGGDALGDFADLQGRIHDHHMAQSDLGALDELFEAGGFHSDGPEADGEFGENEIALGVGGRGAVGAGAFERGGYLGIRDDQACGVFDVASAGCRWFGRTNRRWPLHSKPLGSPAYIWFFA